MRIYDPDLKKNCNDNNGAARSLTPLIPLESETLKTASSASGSWIANIHNRPFHRYSSLTRRRPDDYWAPCYKVGSQLEQAKFYVEGKDHAPDNAQSYRRRRCVRRPSVAADGATVGNGSDPKPDPADVQHFLQAFEKQLGRCWKTPDGAGADAPSAIVRFKLKQDGSLAGEPVLARSHSDPSGAVGKSALAAVKRCQPFRLPPNLYKFWENVEVNFVGNGPI
jgi:hypothetical protein